MTWKSEIRREVEKQIGEKLWETIWDYNDQNEYEGLIETKSGRLVHVLARLRKSPRGAIKFDHLMSVKFESSTKGSGSNRINKLLNI